MIDGVGGRFPLSPPRGNIAANPVPTPAPVRETPRATPDATTRPARDAAVPTPVDTAKVERIRLAIAAGTYLVQPDRIADTMIALDLPPG